MLQKAATAVKVFALLQIPIARDAHSTAGVAPTAVPAYTVFSASYRLALAKLAGKDYRRSQSRVVPVLSCMTGFLEGDGNPSSLRSILPAFTFD